MKQTFLDFEQPIAELQQKIDELRYVHEDSAVDISDEITRLAKKSQQLTKDIYGKLTAWQVAQVARQGELLGAQGLSHGRALRGHIAGCGYAPSRPAVRPAAGS